MARSSQTRTGIITAIAIFAIVFGTVTLFSGGTVLFGNDQARVDAGDYVPFVLWFNFLAGFAYIAAGIGIFLLQKWAAKLSLLIAVATLLVFAAFGIHIAMGGAYEIRTAGAMTLRSAVWLAIAWYSRKAISNQLA